MRPCSPLLALSLLCVEAVVSWTADYNKPFAFVCKKQILNGIESIHMEGKDDRKFNFRCANLPEGSTLTNCRWSGYLKVTSTTASFECRGNGVITGVSSDRSSGHEDRNWKFLCCRPEVPIYKQTGYQICSYTGYVNKVDHYFNYTVPEGKAITGLKSHRNNVALNTRFTLRTCQLDSLASQPNELTDMIVVIPIIMVLIEMVVAIFFVCKQRSDESYYPNRYPSKQKVDEEKLIEMSGAKSNLENQSRMAQEQPPGAELKAEDSQFESNGGQEPPSPIPDYVALTNFTGSQNVTQDIEEASQSGEEPKKEEAKNVTQTSQDHPQSVEVSLAGPDIVNTQTVVQNKQEDTQRGEESKLEDSHKTNQSQHELAQSPEKPTVEGSQSRGHEEQTTSESGAKTKREGFRGMIKNVLKRSKSDKKAKAETLSLVVKDQQDPPRSGEEVKEDNAGTELKIATADVETKMDKPKEDTNILNPGEDSKVDNAGVDARMDDSGTDPSVKDNKKAIQGPSQTSEKAIAENPQVQMDLESPEPAARPKKAGLFIAIKNLLTSNSPKDKSSQMMNQGLQEPHSSREETKGLQEPHSSGEKTKGLQEPHSSGEKTKGLQEPHSSGEKTKGLQEPHSSGEETKGLQEPHSSREETKGLQEPHSSREETKGTLQCLAQDGRGSSKIGVESTEENSQSRYQEHQSLVQKMKELPKSKEESNAKNLQSAAQVEEQPSNTADEAKVEIQQVTQEPPNLGGESNESSLLSMLHDLLDPQKTDEGEEDDIVLCLDLELPEPPPL